jgi:hypothetical protein
LFHDELDLFKKELTNKKEANPAEKILLTHLNIIDLDIVDRIVAFYNTRCYRKFFVDEMKFRLQDEMT